MKIQEIAPKIQKYSSSIKNLEISGDEDSSFMISSALNSKDSIRIVATFDNKIVGAISYYHTKIKTTVIEWLGSSSKGVGTKLIQYAIDDAKRKHSITISLESADKNADDFYKKFNFKKGEHGKFMLTL